MYNDLGEKVKNIKKKKKIKKKQEKYIYQKISILKRIRKKRKI